MTGKHDHREALRPRGWAGSAGGDAEATKGERGGGSEGRQRRSWGRGRKGGEEEEAASTSCCSGGDAVCST